MSNALDLPIGAVFQGYYYPPTFSPISPMQPRLLASMQFTRGHAMVYAERAEYSLYQEWERIEILFTPHRHAADTESAVTIAENEMTRQHRDRYLAALGCVCLLDITHGHNNSLDWHACHRCTNTWPQGSKRPVCLSKAAGA